MSEATNDHSSLPLVYAVVPAFNRCAKTLRFLQLFKDVDYPNKRVIVCDDGSTDNTFFNIRLNFPDVEVLRGNGHLWWSGGTNMAIRRALDAGADYILTINDDSVMDPAFLREMVAIAQKNPKYIVGCRIHREDLPDRIWAIGTSPVFRGYEIFELNFWDQRWDDVKDKLENPYPVHTMPGNGVLIPRSVFEEAGFYDERHMPQYHADSDLVLRAKHAGYQPVISLNSVLYNHILDKPLVCTKRDLIFSKKSDRYFVAVWTTLKRHGPFGKRIWLLLMQYIPFFVPHWMVRLRQRLRRTAPREERIADMMEVGRT